MQASGDTFVVFWDALFTVAAIVKVGRWKLKASISAGFVMLVQTACILSNVVGTRLKALIRWCC